MNKITDIINPDWKANDYAEAKKMVDYGMTLYSNGTQRLTEISDQYRMYHGEYTKEEITQMTMVHGKVSATEFKSYRIAKVKIDQLLGECLEVGLSAEVDTISATELRKKKQEEQKQLGRAYAKPLIKAVQGEGHNIFDKLQIPDYQPGMKINPQMLRSRNELIAQRICSEKIKGLTAKSTYYYAFASEIFTSEVFSRSIVDSDGKSSVQHIPSEQMIYPNNKNDQYNDSAPILGHWQMMTFAEIIRDFKIRKDTQQYKDVVSCFDGSFSGTPVTVPMNSDGTFNFQGGTLTIESSLAIPVYYFQWKYYVDKAVEKRTDQRTKYLDMQDSEVQETVLNDPDKYNVLRFERLYQGASLQGNFYIGFQDVENYAITVDANGNVRALYDYVCTLVKTFGGKRTSFARVMLDLSRQYDKAMWMLFREIKKNKAGATYVNRAFMGTQTRNELLYDLEDSGYVEIDSKDKFDESNEGLANGSQALGPVSNSQGGSVIRDLINICMSIENSLDSITGINDARKGVEQATATATTATNNMQASRSVTFDHFYFTENHLERQLTHLVQKTKSLIYGGSKEAESYLPAEDIEYLEALPDFYRDNFKARIVGGRKSQQIFNELSEIIKSEVTAGKRSSKDWVAIKESDSLSEAMEVLRRSDERMEEIQRSSEEQANATKLQMNENTVQASKENREDEQMAKKDLQDSVNETAIKVKSMELGKAAMTPPVMSQGAPGQQ